MSAVRLEKKLASLEQKLRREIEEELRHSLTPVLARLAALEAQLATGVICTDGLGTDLERGSQKPAASPAQEEGAQGPTPCAPPREGQEESVATEPVPYLDSAWNLAIVLGSSGACWLDQVLACMLLLLSIGMEACFIYIVGDPSFQGLDFENQESFAEQWRLGVAHDHRHAERGVSLAARVCAGDGSLIVSADQRNLLVQINRYLSMRPEDLRPPGLRLGAVLCLLCILLWFLYVCNELRMSCLSLEAVSGVPRGRRSVFRNGRIEVISWPRFVAFLASRLIQMGFDLYLLHSGVLWLAGTTSIQDLILNAVALGAILEIDRMIFSAVLSKSIQAAVQGLDAIKVKFSRRRSQVEAVFMFLCAAGVVVLSFFHLVQPLAESMEAIKLTLCDGNRDFVFARNEDTQLMFALSTEKHGKDREPSISEVAAQDFIFVDDGNPSMYLFHAADAAQFRQLQFKSMEEFADEDLVCLDLDSAGPGVWKNYGFYFRSTALLLGVPDAKGCADLRHLCDDKKARSLRKLCGISCGCDDPLASIWYRSSAYGCTRGCQMKAAKEAAKRTCMDRVEGSAMWAQMWDAYPVVINELTGLDLVSNPQVTAYARTMKEEGCAGLNMYPTAPFSNRASCAAGKHAAPLAYHCPESCGCRGKAGEGNCPESCGRNGSSRVDE